MTQSLTINTEVIPDRTLDSKAFKKQLMDRLRARGGTQSVDTKQLFQSMVKETLEAFLELEMEEHLGYPKHDPEGRGSPQWSDCQDSTRGLRRERDRNPARSQRQLRCQDRR